jgi:ABC-type phosphate/phosphonate transport system ATPase subunit
MPISPTIILDHVSKRFADKPALKQVTATILPGQFVAIIGKSGAGKITLLRCLACSIPVSEGVIRFGDQDLVVLHGAAVKARTQLAQHARIRRAVI